jgi:hypothetical protein
VAVDEEEEYQVSSVKDSWIYRNQLKYLIWWTGYDCLAREPAKLVDGFQVVEEFLKRYPGNLELLKDLLGGPRT